MFARGTDNACWHRWWDGARWGGWESLGGICESLTATSWAPNRLDLFTVGTDSAVWHQAWDGAHWSGWETPRRGRGLAGDARRRGRRTGSTRSPIGTDSGMYHHWWG